VAGDAVTPEPRLVDAGDATLAVREWGPPDGRPLVFWHALGPATSGAMLNEVAPALAARHRVRTIALDAPGYGA
jgi:pimeloyl-ACP methyl ester carboxylesterase